MRRARILTLALLLANPAGAQVTLDGSLGAAGDLLPDGAGDIEIPQGVGRREGGNLFHSFANFGIASGQSATFTAHDAGIDRVLARVTGNSPSQIDGALRSRIPGADLYLFNPAGVFFGNGASLDVDGSLYVSSGDALRLSDDNVLRADPAAGSVLSSAPPSAWEFTGPSAGEIRIDGSRLEVGARRSLSFVGGPIDVTGRTGGRFGEPVLVAPGGRIELVAVGSPGSVELAPDGPDASGIDTLANVSISSNAQLTTAGERSGTVQIRARDLRIANAFLFSDSLGAETPLPLAIDIEVRGDVVITGPAELVTELDGSADTGKVRIAARTLRISGRDTVINSWVSEGSGRGGDVELELDELHMRDGAQIKVESNPPQGRGGHLRIEAERIDIAGLDTYAGAESRARGAQIGGSFAEGIAVTIRADEVSLADGGQILSITRSAGDGADIDVEVGRLRISGAAVTASRLQPAGIVSNEERPETDPSLREWDVGELGSVRVIARDAIEISDGGAIQASSRVREPSPAGWEPGVVAIEAPRITLNGSRITDDERSIQTTISAISVYRDAGKLDIRTDDLAILDGATINATVEGPGSGGKISVRADRIHVAGLDEGDASAGIFAQSRIASGAPGANGRPGGDIDLSVRELSVEDGGVIGVSTRTNGNGGRLSINVGPEWSKIATVLVSNGEIASEATLSSTGNGGNIAIYAREMRVEKGGEVSARNAGHGDAGNIVIVLEDALRMSDGEITTEARDGFGGNVTVTAHELVDLLDSRIETSVTGGTGNGGNIRIDPDLVVLNRSSILARANAGNGGDITIIADEVLSSADSAIDASSLLGIDGKIVITSPVDDLVEEVAPVQADLLGADDLLRRGCAAQRSPSGTLTVAPRVVRIGPDGVLEDEPPADQERCDAQ